MNLRGEKLVLPIFDAHLANSEHLELCDGVRVVRLPNSYVDRLREQPEIVARYTRSLEHMTTAIELCPRQIPNQGIAWEDSIETAVYCAMALRLATGVPVDTPFWFDVAGPDDIHGCGISQMRTYRTGHRYQYPLDEGAQAEGLVALQQGLSQLLEIKLAGGNANPLVRAIEFSSIAFQTRHILARIVNNTIFIESLFSSANTEIAFQMSASVSWYLEQDEAARRQTFAEVKELYGLRSKIVHGAKLSEKSQAVRRSLEFVEALNTRIFRSILQRNHIPVFELNDKRRAEELRLLCLGAGGQLMTNPL